MDDKLFNTYFRSESIPTWPCPICGANSLSCSDDQFKKQYKTPIDTSHPAFDPDWIEYVFSMNLKCTIPSCGCRAVCVGIGNVSQEYLDDGSGNWDWFDNFEVKFFEPPLRLFIPPKETPSWVSKALETSFSTFFSSPGTSLSSLRAALEVLLDELEVASVNEKGSFLSLASRINLLPENFREIVEPANAIKWLGNDGTHSGFQVRRTDVIDGYKIFEHILVELYPEKKATIEALVKRINEAKGVGRKA
ncbi:hypothetical protein CRYPA_463 [uncultured Candidatus Thioglobus sp.]|nr:hypothetical protein CRYPA_463 [uncultured Candidatus Thioglobus sp.]